MTLGNKVSGTSFSIVSVSPIGIDVISGSKLKGTDDSGLSISGGGPEVVYDVPDLVFYVYLFLVR